MYTCYFSTGDCFSYMNNAQFSTYDRDNDVHTTTNCALTYHGAWWYTGCHNSNLNGLYSPVGTVANYAINVCWSCARGFYYSFKKTEMKMRRVA